MNIKVNEDEYSSEEFEEALSSIGQAFKPKHLTLNFRNLDFDFNKIPSCVKDLVVDVSETNMHGYFECSNPPHYIKNLTVIYSRDTQFKYISQRIIV